MKKILRGLNKLRFLLAVFALFVGTDVAFSVWAPVDKSTLFTKNDYEKTVLSHDGKTEYDKVFYGNSVLISSFIEEKSTSGYVNFGLDYGTMTDLRDMLQRGMLKPKQDLVLALNYFVILDAMDTNPTYPWHRKTFEPYFYFQRDRLNKLITAKIKNVSDKTPLPRYPDLAKSVYHGILTDAQLDEKIETYKKQFWGLDTEYYEKNLAALEDVIDYCAKNNVRLRVVWMPWNNYIPMPKYPKEACELADKLMKSRNIEVLDLTDSLPPKYFHDLGHLNYEQGASYFTKEIDKWLNS